MKGRGAKLIALSVALTVVVAGGGTAFFLLHPAGKAALRSFLEWAAAGPVEEPPEEEAPPAEEEFEEEEEATEAPGLDPETLAALARARKALKSGDPDDLAAAESELRAILAEDPDSAEADDLLKQISQKRAEAEKMRRRIAHDEALRAAEEFLAEGDLDRAENRVGNALDEIPESPEALGVREKIAAERKRREEELERKRDRADELAREGNVALAAEEYDRALSLARDALELDPENVAAENLRSQVELAKKRAEEARAEAEEEERLAAEKVAALEETPAGPIELDDLPEPEEPDEPEGPISIEVPREPYEPDEPEGPISIEVPREPDEPDESEGPLFVEVAREPDEPDESEGPLSIEVAREPDEPDEPEGPIAIDVSSEEEEPEEPMSLDNLQPEELPLSVREALDGLDRALSAEDADAIGRMLSERAEGGILSGSSATREEEIANAREFFRVASDIRVERTTAIEDIRAEALSAEARSSFRISYRIAGAEVSRGYKALYKLARERGQWRIVGVTIEDERP